MAVPVLVVGIFSGWKASSSLENVAMQQSTEIAKSLASMAQLAIQEEMKIAAQIASSDMVIEAALRHKNSADADVSKLNAELGLKVKNSGGEYETLVCRRARWSHFC